MQTLVIGLGDSSAGLLPALDAARRSAEGRPLFADRPVVACDIRATAAPDVLLAGSVAEAIGLVDPANTVVQPPPLLMTVMVSGTMKVRKTVPPYRPPPPFCTSPRSWPEGR